MVVCSFVGAGALLLSSSVSLLPRPQRAVSSSHFMQAGHLPVHYASSDDVRRLLTAVMNWTNRKNFLVFLTSHSFHSWQQRGAEGGEGAEATPVRGGVPAQAEPSFAAAEEADFFFATTPRVLDPDPISSHSCLSYSRNAIEKVFDIADLHRYICTFL
jgi:hypothetical protein